MSKSTECNVVSMSGGKDSTAMALLAREREVDNIKYVFADTGHEHALTYEYLDYLEDALDIKIERVMNDFTGKIAHKRDVVNDKWRRDGVPEETIERALAVLQPTGNPFLDLCLWKGRFPSTRRRFCSEELKHVPLDAYIQEQMADYSLLYSWQGVRRDESRSRADLDEYEVEFGSLDPHSGLIMYRPILDWTAADCFDMHRKHGINPNPLYKAGMGRVGCMPCIHATKVETLEIAMRFPEELERLAEWEDIVSQAAKRGASTFFDARTVQRSRQLDVITSENLGDVSPETHGLRHYVEWAKTARGGRQYDLIKAIEIEETEMNPTGCKSIYGLCEIDDEVPDWVKNDD